MKEKEIKYKQLFLTFAWQFCLVILTLNIGASILLAIESKADKNLRRCTKEDLLKNFSLQFNVTVQDLEQLFSELDTLEDFNHNTMTYLEAVMLVVSLFFTIGKSQVRLETDSVSQKMFRCPEAATRGVL